MWETYLFLPGSEWGGNIDWTKFVELLGIGTIVYGTVIMHILFLFLSRQNFTEQRMNLNVWKYKKKLSSRPRDSRMICLMW